MVKSEALSSLRQSTSSFYLEKTVEHKIFTAVLIVTVIELLIIFAITSGPPLRAAQTSITTASQCLDLDRHRHQYLHCCHLYQSCWTIPLALPLMPVCHQHHLQCQKIDSHHRMPDQYLQHSCRFPRPSLLPLGHKKLPPLLPGQYCTTFTIAGTSTTIHSANTSVTTAGASTPSRILASFIVCCWDPPLGYFNTAAANRSNTAIAIASS